LTDAWSRVRWTEARQLTSTLGWPEDGDGPDQGLAPPAYFEALRKDGKSLEAAQFLGLALPRWEAVAWAARSVRDFAAEEGRGPAEAEALKRALLWVSDPTDARRRAAFEAAETAKSTSPERLAALAVFFSGGSLAPENVQAIQAPLEAAGRLAAGAVLAAVFSRPEPWKALAQSLDEGVKLASGISEEGG
jgi:hypothetical protein